MTLNDHTNLSTKIAKLAEVTFDQAWDATERATEAQIKWLWALIYKNNISALKEALKTINLQ